MLINPLKYLVGSDEELQLAAKRQTLGGSNKKIS